MKMHDKEKEKKEREKEMKMKCTRCKGKGCQNCQQSGHVCKVCHRPWMLCDQTHEDSSDGVMFF